MRKAYEKPQIIFDSFELSQSIAAGCEYFSKHEWTKCAVDTGDGDIIFSNGDCKFTPPNPDDYVCYHAPDDSRNVFSS